MSNQLPVVSVVIPMFNVEKYIDQCMQSVLKQTFRNFEVICIDDGCTDATLDRLSAYEDDRIHVIRQKNRGLSGARNTGIMAARGLYVALLDADDFWANNKLAEHVKHLNASPSVGISYSPSLFVDEGGNAMGIGQFPKLKHIRTRDILCRNPIGNGSAPVIRRRLLNDIGQTTSEGRVSYFDENLRQSEDIEFWLRIALQRKWKFEGVETPMTYYRVNQGGLSANLSKQFDSWSLAMNKNIAGNEGFFKRFLPLAKAYQYRYLSRRAVQSGNTKEALRLIHKALLTAPKILTEEPSRTLVTFVCAYLSVLPTSIYRGLEHLAMQCVSRNISMKAGV